MPILFHFSDKLGESQNVETKSHTMRLIPKTLVFGLVGVLVYFYVLLPIALPDRTVDTHQWSDDDLAWKEDDIFWFMQVRK